MNYTTSIDVGIDTVINSIKNELYTLLQDRWSGEIDAYGRVYKNVDGQGKIVPEVPLDNNDLTSAFYNDQKAGVYFFIDSDTQSTEDEIVYTNEVKVTFMVDLTRILPNEPYRPDELARRDVVEFLRSISDERYGIVRVEKGIRSVFRDFDIDSIPFNDISPNHVFSVVIDLNYYLTDKCS